MTRTLTAIVMVLGLVALTGCEKPAEKPADANGTTKPAPTMQAPAGATTQPASTGGGEEPVAATPPEATTQPANTGGGEEPVAAAPTGDLEAIPLELPKPRFAGTPKNLPPGTRLKPLKGAPKPREPFMAPKGVTNVALKKSVISSDMEPVIGSLDMVTDGEKEAVEDAAVELGLDVQWVQVDLGAEYEIYAIVLWHEHKDQKVYKDVVIQIADDKDFITNVRTVYSNDHDNSAGQGLGDEWEYLETNEGLLVDCKDKDGKPQKAQYVRTYSNGNTVDELNRYTEIEVYAKPVK